MKSPQTVGEIVHILSATIANQRGDHWLIDPQAAAAAIGGPLCEWLSKQERRFINDANEIGGKVAIGIGLFSIGLPILLGEIALHQARKQAYERPQPQPTQPATNAAPGVDEPAYPAHVHALYGGSLGFPTGGASAASHVGIADPGAAIGRGGA